MNRRGAFVDSLEQLLKAALAFLRGAAKSSFARPDGFENHFNEQIQDILAAGRATSNCASISTRRCAKGSISGSAMSPARPGRREAEADWRQDIIRF